VFFMLLHSLPKRKLFSILFVPRINKFVPHDFEPGNSHLPFETNSYVQTLISEGKETPWPESANELYRLSNYRLSAKLVPTFADRGCNVVSVASLWQYSWLSRPEPLLIPPSSFSIVLTRLSGPRYRPTTSQKTW
jgi:hypothetical protein